MHSPEDLMAALAAMEEADTESRIASLRAQIDGERIDYRNAGLNPEQQAALVMTAAMWEIVGRNPVFKLFLQTEVMNRVVMILAALK